jgi:Icc-related predicted phosphoesterase
MKIELASDLHLEFGPLELPGGEVLILAGDICEYRTLKKRQSFVTDFFEKQCSKYDRVFMVSGNHESYHHRLDKTHQDFKAILPNNVTILENETVDYNGVVFMGATLWTDLNQNNPLTVQVVKDGMNDYRAIQNHYPTGNYHRLTPEHTYQLHKNTVDYFKTSLAEYQDREVVVITHHAPSYQSIHERYRGNHHMSGAYASDLSEFILDHPQIKIWCHGHVHDFFEYRIGSTRVVCNPRGYVGYEANATHNFQLYDLDI